MEVVKTTKEYTIIKKRSGRFGVKNSKGKWVNKDEKIKVLLGEGLIKVNEPKKEEPAAEAVAEETQEEAAQETTE